MRLTRPLAAALAAALVSLPASFARADAVRVQELRTQKVGPITYFQARVEPPKDYQAPDLDRAGRWWETRKPELALLPRLVPQDGKARTVYLHIRFPEYEGRQGNAPVVPTPRLEGLEFLGKFEEADKGTLFLDEIGELDINLQAKLLRVLQEREITRIGSNGVTKIDVRIVVATHKNLLEEVKNKTFREDLYYRLIGLPISLPPLRERGNDILILSKHFIDGFCKENRLEKKTLSPEAQQKLLQYPFPGNVRELKSVVELAAVMADE